MKKLAIDIPAIERGGGYAEALIEQAKHDKVPREVVAYAGAVILHGLSKNLDEAIARLREVAEYK